MSPLWLQSSDLEWFSRETTGLVGSAPQIRKDEPQAELQDTKSAPLAHWGFEYDALDFFETLVPNAA